MVRGDRLSPPETGSAVGSSMFARRSTIGCLVALGILLAVATVGVTVLDRGVRWTVSRAVENVQAALPEELDEDRRDSLTEALERFEARIDTADEPNALIGRFLGLVSKMLDDRRLAESEVAMLEDFLDRVEAADGVPPDSEPAAEGGENE
jgi:hypothetical protein